MARAIADFGGICRSIAQINLSLPINQRCNIKLLAGQHFGQIRAGRRNGFHLGQIVAWKGNQPSLRTYPSDMFVIPAPRRLE